MARSSWTDVETVSIPVVVPCCPECDCTRFEHVRSEACGDGTSFERAKCVLCGCRFKIFRQPIDSARIGQTLLDTLIDLG